MCSLTDGTELDGTSSEGCRNGLQAFTLIYLPFSLVPFYNPSANERPAYISFFLPFVKTWSAGLEGIALVVYLINQVQCGSAE